jgi:hypothetical protein
MGVALLKTALLCILAIALNMLTSYIAVSMPVLLFPVFWDTIFTVAITFYSGLVPGLIVAAGFNPLMTVLRCAINGTEVFYYDFLYALCGIVIVLVTWAISRNKKEFFFTRMVTILYLLIISLASAFAAVCAQVC